MSETILNVAVDGGAINGYTGINFKNVEDGKKEDELAVKLREIIPKPPEGGGRRRKRRTKVKSKKRANRRRRTRYQH